MEHFAGYKMSALVLTQNWTVRAGFEIFQSSRTREFLKVSSPPQFDGNVETCCDRVLPPC